MLSDSMLHFTSPQVGPHTVYVFWTISVGPTLTPIYEVAI